MNDGVSEGEVERERERERDVEGNGSQVTHETKWEFNPNFASYEDLPPR